MNHLQNTNSYVDSLPQQQDIELCARDFYKHYIMVEHAQDILQWAFRTEKEKPIGFGLFYLYDGQIGVEEANNIIEKAKGELVMEPVSGQAVLTSASSDTISSNIDKSLEAKSRLSRTDSVLMELQVGEMIELLPIQRYVFEEKKALMVRGYLRTPLAGTFVLYFDNSASNSSKKIIFAVNLLSSPPSILNSTSLLSSLGLEAELKPILSSLEDEILVSGWLLKKKRRRLPGWSRRWFILDRHGTLSYYDEPKSICRGQMLLTECTVSKVPSHRLITIDSGTNLYHLKAISEKDYNLWSEKLTAIRLMSEHRNPLIERIEKQIHDAGKLIASVKSEAESRELSRSFESLNVLYSNLLEYAATLKAASARRPSLTAEGLVTSKSLATSASSTQVELPTQIPFSIEEEVFYDVEEIILSDISESEYEENLTETETTFKVSMPLVPVILEGLEKPEHITTAAVEPITTIEGAQIIPEKRFAPIDLLPTIQVPLCYSWPIDNQRLFLPMAAPQYTGVSIAQLMLLGLGIGKDSSSTSMPAALNEPINALQKLVEELEYSELLDRAAMTSHDSLEQLVLMTSFVVSGYANMAYRIERKPFNPMLGETYELECSQRGFRVVAEKVSHKPLVCAMFAESLGPGLALNSTSMNSSMDASTFTSTPNHQEYIGNNPSIPLGLYAPGARWQFLQDHGLKMKPWGRSVYNYPSGQCSVYFPQSQDHYFWTKIPSSLKNIHSSTSKWIDFAGETKLKNLKTGDMAFISFKASDTGLFGGGNSKNEVVCELRASDGRGCILKGRWDGILCRERGRDQLQVVWRVNQMPQSYIEYYGFTYMTLMLNELKDEYRLSLPRTDSRFRPDQRLIEHRQVEEAEQEKARLEQRQREVRSLLESENRVWKAKWFHPRKANNSNILVWEYNGTYWDAKKNASFETMDLPALW